MKYWKHINAGNFKLYGSRFYDYYLNNLHYFYHANDFWHALEPEFIEDVLLKIPEMKDGLKEFGEINEITLLNITESCQTTLHIDHTIGPNRGVLARLNIPILNCEGSLTCFYNLPPQILNDYTEANDGAKFWSEHYRNTIPSVTRVELIQPTILRVSEPHTVFTESKNYPRICITVSFKEDVVKFLD
jgi:hypothetical protein